MNVTQTTRLVRAGVAPAKGLYSATVAVKEEPADGRNHCGWRNGVIDVASGDPAQAARLNRSPDPVGLVVGIGADGWVQWVDAVPCRSDPAVASPAGADSDSVAAVPRSFDFSIESPASVEQIHSAFSEKDYWLARQAASGGVARLDSLVKDTDGSVTVVIIGDGRPEGVSGLVAKFYPRSWQVVQKETWSPIGGGQVRGEISIASHGAPGSGHGTALLAPAQNGSRLKCTGTVEFNVPLIGGKIESMIGRQLVEQISAMLRFTTEWITEHA